MDENITSSEIVSDLVRIHEDRIDEYRQILRDSNNIELGIKTIFERIIEESIRYSRQLKEEIHPEISGPGKIYKLWLSEKVPVADANKKTVLATCAADELIINNTYSMALSMVAEENIRALLEEHQQGLKKLHAHIRQYYHAQ
jgi:hypothetical protein